MRERGFTLIELLITLTIIFLLGSAIRSFFIKDMNDKQKTNFPIEKTTIKARN